MNLYEYQVKKLLARSGLPIPIGYVCDSPYEAKKIMPKIGSGPWVVKCQIHAGGRSKSGGVKFIKHKEEIFDFVDHWIGKRLVTYQTDTRGKLVRKILIEKSVDFIREIYLSAIVDRNTYRIVFLASIKGGVEIEKLLEETPNLIHQIVIDPLMGPMPYQGRELAFQLNLKGRLVQKFTKIFLVISNTLLEKDLLLIEVNPLVVTLQGDFVCLDGKINADENALFRQPELKGLYNESQETYREAKASEWNLNYVELEGNIGCIVNGAGLAMSTIDIIRFYGGEPANFLDIGGSVTKKCIVKALEIILSDSKVKAILVNIFGGIVRCDMIADGIIHTMNKINSRILFVIRFEGNNAELGVKKMASSGLNIFIAKSLIDAVQKIIFEVKKER